MLRRILAGLILGLVTVTADAALHGRLPVTPGGNDYQAYYDDAQLITWLADANAAQTSGYDGDGAMNWTSAQAWITSLNATIAAINDVVANVNTAFVDGVPSPFAQAHLVNGACP